MRPTAANGDSAPPASSGSAAAASGRGVHAAGADGIWFTVLLPGRDFIYRPGLGSYVPSDVKRADRIELTCWVQRGRNAVWAKRRPNYGGPDGPSVRDLGGRASSVGLVAGAGAPRRWQLANESVAPLPAGSERLQFIFNDPSLISAAAAGPLSGRSYVVVEMPEAVW